jgi:hypothetical protein
MNFISSSFSSPVNSATVPAPVDSQSGIPLVADEEQIKVLLFTSFTTALLSGVRSS